MTNPFHCAHDFVLTLLPLGERVGWWQVREGEEGKGSAQVCERKVMGMKGLNGEPWEDEEGQKVLLIQAPCHHVSLYRWGRICDVFEMF